MPDLLPDRPPHGVPRLIDRFRIPFLDTSRYSRALDAPGNHRPPLPRTTTFHQTHGPHFLALVSSQLAPAALPLVSLAFFMPPPFSVMPSSRSCRGITSGKSWPQEPRAGLDAFLGSGSVGTRRRSGSLRVFSALMDDSGFFPGLTSSPGWVPRCVICTSALCIFLKEPLTS